MSETVIIIPARYASIRFPGKPLFPIAGKPLIQHVVERCRKARAIDRIIVATDDMRIARCAFDFGAEVALTPKRLASGTDRAAHVAERLDDASIIINVQGDEPLIDPKLITLLASTLRQDRDIPMATAAVLFPPGADVSNPNQVKVVLDAKGDALYFSRSVIPFPRDTNAKPPGHLRHLGIYAYRRKFLLKVVKVKRPVIERAECLEQLRALHIGARIRVLITRHVSPGVDTPEDAAAVEKRLRPAEKS